MPSLFNSAIPSVWIPGLWYAPHNVYSFVKNLLKTNVVLFQPTARVAVGLFCSPSRLCFPLLCHNNVDTSIDQISYKNANLHYLNKPQRKLDNKRNLSITTTEIGLKYMLLNSICSRFFSAKVQFFGFNVSLNIDSSMFYWFRIGESVTQVSWLKRSVFSGYPAGCFVCVCSALNSFVDVGLPGSVLHASARQVSCLIIRSVL